MQDINSVSTLGLFDDPFVHGAAAGFFARCGGERPGGSDRVALADPMLVKLGHRRVMYDLGG